MRLSIHISAEGEGERHILEQLANLRTYALEDVEMSEEEFAAVLSLFSAGMFTETGDRDDRLTCPNCDGPVDSISGTGIGEDPVIEPCGCTVGWADLPANIYSG